MKSKIVMALFALIASAYGAHASAASLCYVYLTRPCLASPTLAVGRYFADYDSLANQSAVRCLERAQEYKGWCRSPAQEVGVVFQVNGLNVIGAGTGGGHTYINDGVARGSRFHD